MTLRKTFSNVLNNLSRWYHEDPTICVLVARIFSLSFKSLGKNQRSTLTFDEEIKRFQFLQMTRHMWVIVY